MFEIQVVSDQFYIDEEILSSFSHAQTSIRASPIFGDQRRHIMRCPRSFLRIEMVQS
jgi:hypothetical protein